MSSFRLPGVPITLNRRDHRTTHDIQADAQARRDKRVFIAGILAYLAIIVITIALTHSWMPDVR